MAPVSQGWGLFKIQAIQYLKLFRRKRKNADYNEEELIQACRNGESDAQFALVKRYSPLLMSLCRRYVGDFDAPDILQESLIRIFQNLDRYQDFGSFEAWMKKITTRVALKFLKKNYVQKEVFPEEMPEVEVLEPEIYEKMETETLMEHIQNLAPGFRTVFNLYVIEGYTHAEIGEIMGISEATSRSQLSRARQALHKNIRTEQTLLDQSKL